MQTSSTFLQLALCLFVVVVVVDACFPPFVPAKQPAKPQYIRCYHCTGNYTFCALKNTINTCPYLTSPEHSVDQGAAVVNSASEQFQCVLAINFLDQSVYQGCASQCESDQSRFYKRSCSTRNLGNCFDIQCKHAIQDGAFGAATSTTGIDSNTVLMLLLASITAAMWLKN